MKSSSSGPGGEPAFVVRERVRWSDIDAAGIIYFGAYTRLTDIAESEFYRSLGFTYARFNEIGVALPRVHVAFDFFRPAFLDDELSLGVRVGGVGVHSVRLHVEISRGSELLAEGTLIASCIDLARRSIALPEDFATALRAYLAPA
jgi:YbgC/YbaW family acyl-CoA thioester hydrolase